MHLGKGACKLVFILTLREVVGHLFFKDFSKTFHDTNPLFISTDDFDLDLKGANQNSTLSLIRYTKNKDEEQVSHHIYQLFLLGDFTMAIFMDNGHHKLLDLLINDLQMFNSRVIGLISELDMNVSVSFTMRLTSRLYMYTSRGSSIILKELYAVNGKNKVQKVGIWRESTGLIIPTIKMWERRSNLEGMELRVATMSFPPMQKLTYDTSNKTITGGEGLFLDPLNVLAKKLNFTIRFMSPNDKQWGALTKNGSWTGMIGMLVNQDADIAAADISATEARQRVVTFGEAIVEEIVTLISAPNGGKGASSWIYFEIFPRDAWYLTGSMVLIVTACFYMIHYSGINFLHGQFDSEDFTIITGFGLSLSFFRQIYYNVNISCNSTKLLFLTSAIMSYLLYIHYTAYLTAASTYGKQTKIHSFWDVMSGDYEVFTYKDMVYHHLLSNAAPDTAMHEVYHKTMKNRPSAFIQPDNIVDDLRNLLISKKTLIYAGDFFLKSQYKDLQYLGIQEKIRLPLAWAFQRQSELLPLFNYHIHKMKQSGIIERLRQKYLDEKNLVNSETIVDTNVLGYKNVMFPFMALLIGLCVALLQLGIEAWAIFKKAPSNDAEQVQQNNCAEAKDVIDDIYYLLLENHEKLGGMKFLSQMRLLSIPPVARPLRLYK